MTPSSYSGLPVTPGVVTTTPGVRREFPMRRLNARMWGHSAGTRTPGSRAASDPVKLGGCGRVFEGGSVVPVFDTGHNWSPGSLATCDNALLCDFCGPRVMAESGGRFRWHFDDWTAGGGTLLHIRLSLPHSTNDQLTDLLAGLSKGFAGLRKTTAWKAHIVDWVRVLHVRWSPTASFHPHYHVTAFIPAGTEVDVERYTEQLQGAWRDQLFRQGFARATKRHGLFARVFTSALQATYAWLEDRRDTEAGEYNPQRDIDLGHDYNPQHLDDRDHDGGTWALWQLATAALEGDQRCWRAWEELCRAMKGKPVVMASPMLNRLWKAHEATLPELEPVDFGDPVVLVGASLWEAARRAGVTQLGLALGRTHGVHALAGWWKSELDVGVRVVERAASPPLLVERV